MPNRCRPPTPTTRSITTLCLTTSRRSGKEEAGSVPRFTAAARTVCCEGRSAMRNYRCGRRRSLFVRPVLFISNPLYNYVPSWHHLVVAIFNVYGSHVGDRRILWQFKSGEFVKSERAAALAGIEPQHCHNQP